MTAKTLFYFSLYCNKMIIPVRCFTCGKVIGNKYDSYLELLASDNSARYDIYYQNSYKHLHLAEITLSYCIRP